MLWWREKFPRLCSINCNEFDIKYDPPDLPGGIERGDEPDELDSFHMQLLDEPRRRDLADEPD